MELALEHSRPGLSVRSIYLKKNNLNIVLQPAMYANDGKLKGSRLFIKEMLKLILVILDLSLF